MDAHMQPGEPNRRQVPEPEPVVPLSEAAGTAGDVCPSNVDASGALLLVMRF